MLNLLLLHPQLVPAKDCMPNVLSHRCRTTDVVDDFLCNCSKRYMLQPARRPTCGRTGYVLERCNRRGSRAGGSMGSSVGRGSLSWRVVRHQRLARRTFENVTHGEQHPRIVGALRGLEDVRRPQKRGKAHHRAKGSYGATPTPCARLPIHLRAPPSLTRSPPTNPLAPEPPKQGRQRRTGGKQARMQ